MYQMYVYMYQISLGLYLKVNENYVSLIKQGDFSAGDSQSFTAAIILIQTSPTQLNLSSILVGVLQCNWSDLTERGPHRKRTSPEVNLKERRPNGKTASPKDNLTGK